jgi:putative SOS response-associated peptidase YedK
MCGRYASSRDAAALVEVLRDLGIPLGDVEEPANTFRPSWNVAPTSENLVVAAGRGGNREDASQAEPSGLDGPPGRSAMSGPPPARLAVLSWGLVPSWAEDRRGAARMINARIETVAQRSAYRSLLPRRRCLVPADAWYEWQANAPGGKQPFAVRPADGAPVLLLAGLYTWWRDRQGIPDPATGATPWLGSFTILTAPARPELSWLHDRMPVVVPRHLQDDWLDVGEAGPDPASLVDAVRSGLSDPQTVPLTWHPVDRRVGSVANDEPSLLEPSAG